MTQKHGDLFILQKIQTYFKSFSKTICCTKKGLNVQQITFEKELLKLANDLVLVEASLGWMAYE